MDAPGLRLQVENVVSDRVYPKKKTGARWRIIVRTMMAVFVRSRWRKEEVLWRKRGACQLLRSEVRLARSGVVRQPRRAEKKKLQQQGTNMGGQRFAIGNCPFYSRCRQVLCVYVKMTKERERQLFGKMACGLVGIYENWTWERGATRAGAGRQKRARRPSKQAAVFGGADSEVLARSGPAKAVGAACYSGLPHCSPAVDPWKTSWAWWGLAVRRPT